MVLEPDQAGAQSHSHPQSQAHPIPLYESDNYIYYVEGLQWPHNGFIKQILLLSSLLCTPSVNSMKMGQNFSK